jgi:hypothetical protein
MALAPKERASVILLSSDAEAVKYTVGDIILESLS